jgi:hypothetical protein
MRKEEAMEWDTREMGGGGWAVYLTFKHGAGIGWCGAVWGEC